ncbi:MAG: 4-hydroxy-3-methylbut-2-enyl diphosphate reductase [Ferruginibacter sp.]
MKQFTIPISYRSEFISRIKEERKAGDKMKKDFTPTLLKIPGLEIYLARHFGFCYGVENAIEIAFRTIEENPGRNIYLLSEMIHNPQVNADLIDRGVKFLQDTLGNPILPLENLSSDDIVLIPAFGTTLAIEKKLKEIGIQIEKYNTTCPFVEKVWNRSNQISRQGFSVIIHGKPNHEETRATFSHAAASAPSLIINDMSEAISLSRYIRKEAPAENFYQEFDGRYSTGFDVTKDLLRIGVVNQTTMLASDTQEICDFLRQQILLVETVIVPNERFADTRDTLCYATNDNQSAVYGLLETEADFAIVVGGYNSSNTSHLVELCEEKLSTYFIQDDKNILNDKQIQHFDLHTKRLITTTTFLPTKDPVKILVTSGASCPDAIVEKVIEKLVKFYSPGSELNTLEVII